MSDEREAARHQGAAHGHGGQAFAVGVFKEEALTGEAIDIGGLHNLVAVAAEFVSTGIFEGEPENIGPFVFLVVCRIRLGGMQPAESGTHE